ncbi:hypothetical protein O181_015288 [Austropuccinia psidii MF-1]|uniref:Uncharacterized protein n=1 Tax=Austropuccinia psidii MF-1 TaxID=1389203 RepID=A0A9Q3C2Y4_9BASI|nr:hypothetical protein [Austropuccinia psidii MF-1]
MSHRISHHHSHQYQCLENKEKANFFLSSSEGEYKPLTDLSSELTWFRQLFEEIRILVDNKPISVHENNQGCIDTANSNCNKSSRCVEDIDIQLNFIQEVITSSIIQLKYTPTANMLADFLTKAVCRPAMKRAITCLMLLKMEDKGIFEEKNLSQSRSS